MLDAQFFERSYRFCVCVCVLDQVVVKFFPPVSGKEDFVGQLGVRRFKDECLIS